MTRRRLCIALLVLALPLAAGACARPVGAVRADPRKVQRELTGNVLSTGELSRSTRNVLFLDPGVTAHSIIAVKGSGPVETGDDGVVRYERAHIDGVNAGAK